MAMCVRTSGVVLAMLLGLTQSSAAQQPVAKVAREEVSDTDARAVLTRRVTLNVVGAPLRVAVQAIATQAKVVVAYQPALLDSVGRPITLNVVQQPLGVVLAQLLAGSNLQVVVAGPNAIALKPMVAAHAVTVNGIISGVVTDAKTKRPMRDVSVALDDSVKLTRTDDMGRYAFTAISAGAHKVSVRFVGYVRQVKLVNVTDDQTATVTFALESSVNTLDQVVVTATGAQRVRELGHIVAQINADSVVREAPVTNFGELLTARVPGLQVLPSSGGVVGGEVALRIRGTSTTALDPQPIVIVDGIRYKNTNFNGSEEDTRPFNAPPRSPLNDLNVNDIENVEIVKGPSASTLYGPDASNGVIVVTTKHGRIGKPQWHIYAYPDLSTLNVSSINRDPAIQSLQGWGHVPGTSDVFADQCTLFRQAAGWCVLDSLVVQNIPSQDPQRSVIAKQRPQWHSGANVSGGVQGFRYFYSGNLDSETGALRLSPQAATIVKSQLGTSVLSGAMRNPNTQQAFNFQANVSSQINATSSVALVAHYTQVAQRAMDIATFLGQGAQSAVYPGADSSEIALYNKFQLQSDAFLNVTHMDVHRFTGAIDGTTQLWSLATLHVTVGTDIDHTTDQAVRGSNQRAPGDGGQAYDNSRANVNRNAHIGLTGALRHGVWSFRTSAGSDYNYTNLDGLNTSGQNLAPGSNDITTASYQTVSRIWNEIASLGVYGEEVVGVRDRLFLTGSLRLDGSTSFGDAYTPRPYPKIGLSWVVSDEPFMRSLKQLGLDEARVRYSFGAASRYPTSAMKLGEIAPSNSVVEDRTQAVFQRVSLANALLKPEKSQETEYGADATFASKVRIEFTWNQRRTEDQLGQLTVPYGFLGGWANVGTVSAHGFEATVEVKTFESSAATLNLLFTYAYNTNKLLNLGSASERKSVFGSVVAGYPINSAFGTTTVGYADTATLGGLFQSGDGYIVTPSEVVSSPVHYLGMLIAPKTYTFTPALALLHGRLRITSLFDRQAGGVQLNALSYFCASARLCRSAFLKSTPLLQQAVNVTANQGDEVVSSNFTRWRELSVTGDLPQSVRDRLHLSRASASFQLRNLALWTPSLAPDAESVPGLGTVAVGGSNGAWGIPQPRTWAIRFDIAP